MKRAMQKFGDEARAAFAKVGVLMASARRTAQALHPTNLHVNTSAVPARHDPEPPARPRLARGLARQPDPVRRVWENKVVERILHNLGLLLERSFASVQELNRYRKEVTAKRCRGRCRASPRPTRAASRPERAGPPRTSGLGRGTFLPGLAIGGDALCARPLADEPLVCLPVDAAGGEQVFAVDRLVAIETTGERSPRRRSRPGVNSAPAT